MKYIGICICSMTNCEKAQRVRIVLQVTLLRTNAFSCNTGHGKKEGLAIKSNSHSSQTKDMQLIEFKSDNVCAY